MATNRWVIDRGETGAIRTGTLSDSAGTVDLSQFDSVNVVAKKTVSSDPIIDSPVTIDPDQVANEGDFSFEFSEVDADHPDGTYKLAFRCDKAGQGSKWFPLNAMDEQTWGKLIIQGR